MDQYKKLLDFRAPTLECPVNALAISPDGRLLAVCSDDNRVHVVSIRSNARVYKSISTHVGAMSTALWATDREGNLWLFTAGYSGVVCIYRIRLVSSHLFGDDQIVIEQDVAPVTLGDEPVEDMVLDAFSRHMAVVCPSRIYVLEVNVNDSAPLKIRDHHPDKVDPSKKNPTAYAAAFCTDEGGVPILVVSYVDSRTLRAFKVRPWSLLWERHTGFKPSTLAWVPERRYLLVYCIESLEVKVLELQDKQLILYTTLASSRPNTHKFKKIISSADHGRFALCGSDEGLLMSWDLSSGKQLSTTLDHGHGTRWLASLSTIHLKPCRGNRHRWRPTGVASHCVQDYLGKLQPDEHDCRRQPLGISCGDLVGNGPT
ncbi:WD40 repeat-like protein [Peniophora sp. CONT]|nr:WD40 repeat-like protein [Peniophora sp. CONT]